MARQRARAMVHWTPPEGGERRQSFHDRVTVGRSPANDIILAGPSVSRRHATLTLRGGVLYLRNFSRSAPIGLSDGRSLGHDEEVRVGPGDVLLIGGQRLIVLDVTSGTDAPAGTVCRNRTCRRQVPGGRTDCPWCGTSLAFAQTLPDTDPD